MIKYLGKVNNQDISIPENVYTVYDPLKNIEVVSTRKNYSFFINVVFVLIT